MAHVGVRNFNCPDTEERCTNTACTALRCLDQVRRQNAMAREAVEKENRRDSARFWEVVGPILGVSPPR